MVDKFQYKTYRCEWQVQCGEVDQYGQNFKPYRTDSFPTQEEAKIFLSTIAILPGEYMSWRPKDPPHDYCEARLVYREVEVK